MGFFGSVPVEVVKDCQVTACNGLAWPSARLNAVLNLVCATHCTRRVVCLLGLLRSACFCHGWRQLTCVSEP